uniref:Uncharacterized protein n=1 Tax=Arundo donax TaxID=35708 RepID=A0A0A8YYF5_ARUDO
MTSGRAVIHRRSRQSGQNLAASASSPTWAVKTSRNSTKKKPLPS